jgi:peptidoglycan/LPS O-acetylase OafA/YrhL
MSPARLSFVDWMKCLGMALIVLGHTGAQNYIDPTPPFNFKQLGVAFFVFVTGFSLARESRGSALVLYNRLFEILLFGWLFALLLSSISWVRHGDLIESNYTPLFLGLNVFFNHFPANPTTWYIGTYLHLLILWALVLRHWQIRPWMVVACALAEVVVRAVLIQVAGNYIAYMLLTNWTTLLLLGMWVGQRRVSQEPAARPSKAMVEIAVLIALVLVFPRLISAVGVAEDFPFQRVVASSLPASLLATSAAVSFLYLVYTALAFRIALHLQEQRAIRFLAENTLIVFIIHMPLIYLLAPTLYAIVPPGPGGTLRMFANLLVFFALPAGISYIVRQVIMPLRWREWLLAQASGFLARTRAVAPVRN